MRTRPLRRFTINVAAVAFILVSLSSFMPPPLWSMQAPLSGQANETQAKAKKAGRDNKEAKKDAKKPEAAANPNAVDYEMVTRIRTEAFRNSRVMDTLSQLADVIGPRLTNSPNQKKAADWVRDQLRQWGMENVHFEAWGPYGRGWSYQASTARLLKPDTAELIALPKAWTRGTEGPLRGKPVRTKILTVEDFAKYRGKLAGAIVMNGELRPVKADTEPKSQRYSEAQLRDEVFTYAIPSDKPTPEERRQERAKRIAFLRELNRFFEAEKVAAVIEPSRAPGDGGTVFVQGNALAYKRDEPVGPPTVVMDIEHYGRLYRMLEKNADVVIELDVRTQFHDNGGDDFGYNVVAEIPGADLKDQVVMLGAHLDSWHGGTGATDNGAGSAVMMEAMRILKAVGARPRRTVRLALWTGEEQGLLGSRGYVAEHLAERPLSSDAAEKDVPEFMRKTAGPLQLKPEHGKVSIYFNVDSGTGKIRGVYLQENAALGPIFEKWMEPFRDLGMNTLSMRNTGGSDFLSFDAVGVPGVDFLQDEIEYESRTHHSNMDTYERIQRDDMLQASAIVASFVYQAAMRDLMMPRKPIPAEPPPTPVASPSAASPEPEKDAAGKKEEKKDDKKDDKKVAPPEDAPKDAAPKENPK